MGSRIVATGRALPRTAVTNQELARIVDTSDEWVRSRTGIGRRYVMSGGESLVDIGPDLKPVPRQLGLTENLTLHHIPAGGKLYRIESKGGKVSITPE